MNESNGNNSSEIVYGFDVDYTCASLARFPASLVKAVVKGVEGFAPYAPFSKAVPGDFLIQPNQI